MNEIISMKKTSEGASKSISNRLILHKKYTVAQYIVIAGEEN